MKKFYRGKSKKTDSWVYGEFLCNSKGFYIGSIDPLHLVQEGTISKNTFHKDKKGKDIFVGDIVQNDNGSKGLVIDLHNGDTFFVKDIKKNILYELSLSLSDITVIGDRFEKLSLEFK